MSDLSILVGVVLSPFVFAALVMLGSWCQGALRYRRWCKRQDAAMRRRFGGR